ncbi:MAG TPA: POTRA domain-containing protein [Polyangiaceae bacterium]|jgi:outer membrane protein insertion porin family/translocation and assembly module TamA
MSTRSRTQARTVPALAVAVFLGAASFASLGCSTIPPGRSAVDSVHVDNTKELKSGDVEDQLATQASAKFLFLFQGIAYDYSVYDEAVLQRDMARVERFYRSKGFFGAHARVAKVEQVSSSHVRVHIVVDEGPATRNRRVVVTGLEGLPKDVCDAVQAAARAAVPEGQRFDEKGYGDAKGAVQTELTDRGYAWAKVESQAEVDVGTHTADYGFSVVPGPPAVFGPVTITGLDPAGARQQEIPEAPLRRAIDITPGTTYSTAEIKSATQALLDLGVFSAVDIEPALPDPPPANRVVPLTVKVEPTRLRQVTLGGGVEIDEIKTDLHLIAGWENRNFLGGLRDFSAKFKPGVVLYPVRIDNLKGPVQPLPEEWLTTQLRQPGFLEARTTGFVRPQFNIFPLLVEVDPPANAPVVGYREVKVPIGLDRTFWKKLFVSLDYNVQVENPFAYVQSLDPALETVVLSFPELRTNLDLRDNAVKPHEGIYLGNTVQVAGGVFGGTATDVREQPEVRTYVPVARGVTFATRASVGFLWSSNYGKGWEGELEGSDVSAAPPATGLTPPQLAQYEQARTQLEHDTQIMYFRGFFSGGPVTNRGFPLLGVAPHGVVPFLNPATAAQQVQFSCDPNGPNFNAKSCFLPVGGFTLWEFQNEVRFDISGPLSATVFCDMSDVSPHENDIRLSHLHLSCGLGAAYDTPVGPVRLDIGYRVQPLQVLGYKTEGAAFAADPLNGEQPTILGLPLAIAIGIGQAY